MEEACLQSMAELDKISHAQGRFKALITYILLKKFTHTPAILCRLGKNSRRVDKMWPWPFNRGLIYNNNCKHYNFRLV